MTDLRVAALQLPLNGAAAENIAAVADLVRQAAGEGAQIVLPPELFAGPYFCKRQEEANFALAEPVGSAAPVLAMQGLAKELGIAIPTSFFERDGPHHYNSLAMIGPDSAIMGVYRKSHIPDGPGYQEKFYFRPGDTGFKVWETRYGKIGVGICWDQWFPEAARTMALMGADILLYPTAIGNEPQDETLDTSARWRRAMQGHAVSNVIPIVAANRVGDEDGQVSYGTSFICDQVGEVVADMDRTEEGIITASFDLDTIDRDRAAWGFFRDRRPDLYSDLL